MGTTIAEENWSIMSFHDDCDENDSHMSSDWKKDVWKWPRMLKIETLGRDNLDDGRRGGKRPKKGKTEQCTGHQLTSGLKFDGK